MTGIAALAVLGRCISERQAREIGIWVGVRIWLGAW